jgi:hypothetical protein
MGWLMNRASRRSPAARRRCAFRPRLEALEDRRLLNASAVLDAAGNTFRLNVDATGRLTETYLGQTTTLANGVLRAHAYRDSNGGIGITVVYDLHNGTFAAYDYDHTGGHYLGNNVIDVDKAYDRAGRIQEDLTYSGPTGFSTVEYTSTGAYVVPQGGFYGLLIHPFQDAWGALGEDVSYVTLGPSGFSTTLIEYDSAGAHYQGRDAVADRYYDPAGRGFLYDVTFKGDAAFEYTDKVVTPLGSSGLFLSAGLPSVVYASRSGCYCDANLGDPTVGHDDSANLQALIDAVPAGRPLTIVIDAPMKLGNVKLRSGITIQGLGGSSYGDSFPASGVIQSPNTVCVFRNFDWTSNYNNGSPVSDFSTIIDQNITVTDLFINGNRGTLGVNNACGGNADSRYVSGGDGYNNRSLLPIYPLTFFGVRNLQINNVFVYDPGVGCVLGSYLDNYQVRGVRVVSPAVYSGQASPGTVSIPYTVYSGAPYASNLYAAVLVGGNCRGGLVENVSGYYHSALFGVITDALVPTSDSNHATPVTAYYPAIYYGPVTDLRVRGLRADLAAQMAYVWSGANTGNVSLTDRIIVEQCEGTVFLAGVTVDGPVGPGILSSHGQTVFRGFNVDLNCGTYIGSFACVEGAHTELRFDDWDFRVKAATSVAPYGDGLFFMSGDLEVVGLVSLSRLRVEDTASGLDYSAFVVNQFHNNGWSELLLDNVSFRRSGAVKGKLLRVAANCQPGALTMTDCLADTVKNFLAFDSGGAPANVTLSGSTHVNAGGNATVLVDGVTLPRLRASGSNTALLVATINGGVILSKKTDGTEDA